MKAPALTLQRLSSSTFSSRQSLPNCLPEQELPDQQSATNRNARWEQISIFLVFLGANRCFFQLVYVSIDVFQRLRIGRAVKFSVGDARDLAQSFFIKRDWHPLIINVAPSVGDHPAGLFIHHRKRRDPVGANADGIKMNVQRFQCFCGGVRRNLAGVVIAIGQKNHHATLRLFGRASINFRVTSRTASNRVASSPPMVKSFASIEFETSSTSMMSMPLASTCVSDFPSCGRAMATMNAARASQISARKICPARLALLFPIARNGAVAEKTMAARGPNLPRSQASSGINSNNSNNHGRANVSVCPASQSCGDKGSSFHKLTCFIQ